MSHTYCTQQFLKHYLQCFNYFYFVLIIIAGSNFSALHVSLMDTENNLDTTSFCKAIGYYC